MKETIKYNNVVKKLHEFFDNLNYIEVPVQSRLSILAACEDPKTVSTFVFDGQSWPLPQTGQMWLERELLENPQFEGVYCISTSYRNEPNPIPGRHDKIFPMFEFEGRGDIGTLLTLEQGLLRFLDIKYHIDPRSYCFLAKLYNVEELTAEHEERIYKDYGYGIFIKDFPEFTSPFWNMKRNDNGTTRKVDVILGGMETIGSAERETDTSKMKERFHSISDGEYAGLLYRHFGKDRVDEELENYFSLPMTERFGGGIGLTRLIKVMED